MKLESKEQVRKRLALSIVAGITCLLIAIMVVEVTPWLEKSEKIDGENIIAKSKLNTLIILSFTVLGMLILAVSGFFYLGWRNEYIKKNRG